MINVIATIRVKEGQRDAFLDIFKSLMPQVQAEEGCLEYYPATDVASDIDIQENVRANCVTVMEKWQSIPALQAHLAAPHMDSFRRQVNDLVEGLSIQVLEPQA